MEKEISVNRFFKVFRCFMCLLLLLLLAMNTVSALECDNIQPLSEGETENDLVCQLKMHLSEPVDQQWVNKLEELIAPEDPVDPTRWCTHCHEEKSSNP
ncbi:MAG: hypothetical protein SWE60_09910 [Thermodesulfobacteriota bacterium]|nr:hypothetical protein [Thermodesulfobacteriota bacterium]